MSTKEARNRAQYKYAAANLKRVPLDLKITDYDELKQCAMTHGETVNGFIKQAIRERIDKLNQDKNRGPDD